MDEITVVCKDCGTHMTGQIDPGPGGHLPDVAVHLMGDFYTTSSGAVCLDCADTDRKT